MSCECLNDYDLIVECVFIIIIIEQSQFSRPATSNNTVTVASVGATSNTIMTSLVEGATPTGITCYDNVINLILFNCT